MFSKKVKKLTVTCGRSCGIRCSCYELQWQTKNLFRLRCIVFFSAHAFSEGMVFTVVMGDFSEDISFTLDTEESCCNTTSSRARRSSVDETATQLVLAFLSAIMRRS